VVTSLHQPFLTLLRTEANKGGRGLGWGIRRPQRGTGDGWRCGKAWQVSFERERLRSNRLKGLAAIRLLRGR